MQAKYKNLSIAIFLLFFSILAHLLFIVNTTHLWDAALYEIFFNNNYKELFLYQWEANGRAFWGHFYWFLSSIDTTWSFKFTTITAIFMSSVIIFFLLIEFFSFSKKDALLISSLGICFPAYQVHLSFTTIVFIVCLPFFLLSFYFLLKASKTKSTKNYFAYTILGVLCALISFLSEATIVIFYGIILTIFICNFKEKKITLNQIKSFSLHNFHLLILPISYLVFMYLYFPVEDSYEKSRELNFSLYNFVKYYTKFIASSFDFNILNPFEKFSKSKNLIIIFLILVLLTIKYKSFFKKNNIINLLTFNQKSKKIYLFFTVIIFFLLTALPFVLASRSTSVSGWNLRHLVLASYPAVIISYFIIRIYSKPENFYRNMYILLFFMFFSLQRDYIIWGARAAHDQALSIKFSQNHNIKEADIVYREDKNYSPIFKEYLRIYEWLAISHRSYNSHSKWITDEKNTKSNIEQYALNYGIQKKHTDKFFSKNCKSTSINISKNNFTESPFKSGLQYFIYKLLSDDPKLKSWLTNHIDIEVKQIKKC